MALASRARPGDGVALGRAFDHAKSSDRRNLLIALLRAEADDKVSRILPGVVEELSLDPPSKTWLRAWAAAGHRPSEPMPPILPELAYMPNLPEPAPF